MEDERGDPVIGCKLSGTFKGARVARAKREPEEGRRRLRARDFEVSGKPERLARAGFSLPSRDVAFRRSRSCWPRIPGHL